MAAVLDPRVLALVLLLASGLYVRFRGRERLKFSRQLTDHSTFLAPYNVFVYACSAVENRPLLDAGSMPSLKLLRDHWQVIRDEAQRLEAEGDIHEADAYNDVAFNSFYRRGWKRFYFKWCGDWLPSAQRLAPRTTELLQQVPGIHAAMFALLPPHSKLVRHRDPFAGSLRYHLGLATPNSDDCHISIDGEPYSWRDGEDVLFDETYVHRARNDTDQPRIILFCDVERPLRYRFATAINRFVIRHFVGVTQTRNAPGEKVGLANRLFGLYYRGIRLPRKRLKKRSRSAYFAISYGALAAALAGLFWI